MTPQPAKGQAVNETYDFFVVGGPHAANPNPLTVPSEKR